jgi:hypothetical protein
MYLKKFISIFTVVLLLTACSKSSNDGGDDPQQGDFGSATFYHNAVFPCNTIAITISGPSGSGNESTGSLGGANVVTGVPNCDVPNTFTFLNLAYGVYQFSYTCGTTTLFGQFSVNKDCFTVLMTI